jgi:hypothetical protein|tara:strand:- start:167 stop:1354 length:1188 start_codon:yes stop_codon:yes gene_type:complete
MTGKNKIVHFLSASDRVNYGDLLFPLIFKNILNKFDSKIEFINYGIIRSNLIYFGALKTHSYFKLIRNTGKFGGNLVVGGGEVFFANWSTLFGFINPIYAYLKKYYTFNIIEKKYKLSKYLLIRNQVDIPFVPSLSELSDITTKIFYNSVGGNFSGANTTKRNKIIINNLQEANHISVRDRRTQKSLDKFDVNSELSPDSALIMSDLFPISYLENVVNKEKLNLPKSYIFLQIGINKAPKNLDQFVTSFMNEAKSNNLSVVLCPIGMAPNHEDHKILDKILSYSEEFMMIIPENVFEIMYMIAKSDVYVGTSLHGLITAQSFNVPFIPLNEKIGKMNAYCKTWTSSVCIGCTPFDDIFKMTTILNHWNFDEIKKDTINQKVKVYANFDKILNELI